MTETTDQRIAEEVLRERGRQDARWGEQNHPDGTGGTAAVDYADVLREQCEAATRNGYLTFRHILAEEVAEAFAENDPISLRAELVQVAAIAQAWIAKLDRRAAVDEHASDLENPSRHHTNGKRPTHEG